MHALVLIAALLGSSPQPASAEAQKPEPTEATPQAKPEPKKPVRAEARQEDSVEGKKAQALNIARQFEEGLLDEDPRLAVSRSSFPFTLEGKRYEKPEELLSEWIRQLHGRRVDLLVLYGIEVLTPAELEQKYGKPPARLAAFPRSSHLLYAVANVSGHGAVLALSEGEPGQWTVVGYTD